MSEACPDCNAELTENRECSQCGFGVVVSSAAEVVDEIDVNEAAAPVAVEATTEIERDWSSEDDDAPDAGENYQNDDYEEELPDDEDGEDVPGPTNASDIKNKGQIGVVVTGTAIIGAPLPSPEIEEKTLFELTQPLPEAATYNFLPDFSAKELETHAQELKDDRLLLLNGPDEDIGLSTAHKLIAALNLPEPLKKRLLNFDKIAADDPQPNIYNLIRNRNPEEQIVVLADATIEKGKEFLKPILTAGLSASIAIKEELRQNNMYLICLINPTEAEESLRIDGGPARLRRDFKFPCWPLPFLHRLLEQYEVRDLDGVEAALLRQRKDGWWSPNDRQFYHEVRNLLDQEQLLDQIKENDRQPPPAKPNELFKGNEPLSDTVLYVASFFPDLTPYEFNQLVSKLLKAKLTTGNSDLNHRAVTPAIESALNTWQAVPDQILENCKLLTTPTGDVATAVNFRNHSLREGVREHLVRRYRFFLENKFQQIQELGLIFDRSPRLSQSAIKLSVEMANSYPEYYGSEWLASLVIDFEKFFAEVAPGELKSWRFIEEINPVNARKRFYQTVAALLREMLQNATLSEVISEFLDQLLFIKHEAPILDILKRLQFEPAFDQFRWLKQLFHRGGPQIRDDATEYLRNYLKRAGVRLYQALESLESWLPSQDRPLDIPAQCALRLIHSYFDHVIKTFDTRYFGAWPSACPLFAFKDRNEAAKDLELLVRLLFHPSLQRLDDPSLNPAPLHRRLNTLITKWFFILRGPAVKALSPPLDQTDDAAAPLDGVVVAELLLQAVAHVASATQQIRLLDHWREQQRLLLGRLGFLRYGSESWAELAWKRELLGELILNYEQLPAAAVVLQPE